jgi:uncharacterized DUF497 family protein
MGEKKRLANLRKHGSDFAMAERVFADLTWSICDDREEYGEERFATLGLLNGVVVVIVHTERSGSIRIISMRKADTDEEKSYFAEVRNGLEANSSNEG